MKPFPRYERTISGGVRRVMDVPPLERVRHSLAFTAERNLIRQVEELRREAEARRSVE